MRRLAILLLSAFPLTAQTIDGIVQNAAGVPLGGMSVAATLLPVADAEDVTATTISDHEGRFHFAQLKPGKYGISASSAKGVCGGATTVDVTAASAQTATIVAEGACRTIMGRATGSSGAHVIAGRFHNDSADIYAVPVRDGRYSLTVPAGGTVVVQAIAPRFMSVETPVNAPGDVNLVLEQRFTAAPPAVRQWIARKAIAMKTVEAGNGFADMEPLRAVVGDARIVALGEATHGTREFFQFKHRMLEFLVAKMGFNIFAIEASEPDAIAIDEYVVNGTGDPATALRNLGFWTWNTEEVLGMIRWMRKWNEDPSHATKVRFYGFDMQSPSAAKKRLRKWLAANQPDAIPLLDKESLDELAARVDAYAPHDAAWQTARHFVELMQQAVPLETDRSARDRAMARNIEWILGQESPKSRMVVWAHNGHISAEPLAFSPGGTMGVHLRKRFGHEMLVVGFAFDHGSFRAIDTAKKALTEHTAAPLDEGSFDHVLATSGPPLFVLDLRAATGDARRWLDSALPMRSIGAVYNDAAPKSFVSHIHPLRSFDAIFFVNETTSAKQAKVVMAKPAPAAVNLSLDAGLTGWNLSGASVEAGYTVSAKTEGCVSGGCAAVARPAGTGGEGFGSFAQRIDATPYRGKKVRLQAKMKSTLAGAASTARIWLRVDRPEGMGFFDNMDNRAPHSLSDWTTLEITGDVAPDAVAIAFGMLMVGDGTALIDEVTLDVVP